MLERIMTDHLINSFEEYLYEEEKSVATIEKYMRDLQKFTSYAKCASVEKKIALAYKEALSKKYAPSSVNSMIAALNAFFRFAGWNDCCVKQLKIQHKAYCSEEKELTRREYERLVRTAEKIGNGRLSLILQTICGTGIRVSELEYITVESLDIGEAHVNCKGKHRVIFIVPELRTKLRKYVKQTGIIEGPVFVTKTGKPVNRSNIWREMKELCKEANVDPRKVYPHNLRHLFARVFYGLEKDIAKLADVLGHTSINTTRIYITTTGIEHKKKMEMMKLIL